MLRICEVYAVIFNPRYRNIQGVTAMYSSLSHAILRSSALVLAFVFLLPQLALVEHSKAASIVSQPGDPLKEATVTLDNVTLIIRTPFLPSSTFGVSDSVATSSNPTSSLNIATAPYGAVPAAESFPENPLPPAQAGGADIWRAKLREYIINGGGDTQPGPTASLFDQKVGSIVTLLMVSFDGSGKVPIMSVEWVVEAGKRLWIIRITKNLPQGTTDLASETAFLQSLESMSISSGNLDNPSTLTTNNGIAPGMPPTGGASLIDAAISSLLSLALSITLVGGLLLLYSRGVWRKHSARRNIE